VILSAQAELDGAKAAEAESYAVYEYTAAEAYLHKAREEQGYADFGPAIDFASKAEAFAKQGQVRAGEKKLLPKPAPAVLPAPPDAAEEQPKVIIQKRDDAPASGSRK
jgi:hypothetical protein